MAKSTSNDEDLDSNFLNFRMAHNDFVEANNTRREIELCF